MDKNAGHSPALTIPLSINAAAFIAAGALMIVIARTGSLSPLRLIPIAGAFLVGVALLATVVALHLHPRTEKALLRVLYSEPLAKRLKLALAVLFVLSWCLTWLPPQDAGNLRDYFIGIYPLILCGTLLSSSGLVLLLFGDTGASDALWTLYWKEHRPALKAMLYSLLGFAVIVLLTHWLQVLRTNEPYWRGASVPILASQVFLTLIIAILALKLEPVIAVRKVPLDLIIFVLIWVLAAVLWASRPVPPGSWVTDPRPPNAESYPFSDSMIYDLGSQFALIGQGINNHVFFDRAIYMSFLVYLHTLLGQNYQQVMAGQAVLFAVFPALLYSIAASLHSRNAGVILAGLTILRGLNSLTATPWIHSATFKHMLTDFPTALALAVFVLLVLKWLESPRQRRHLLIWSGGVLGLASLLRPHVLLLLPLLVVVVIWIEAPLWRTRLLLSGLVLVAALVGVLPWIVATSDTASPIIFYSRRIHDVLVQRYPGFAPPPTPGPPQATAVPAQGTPLAVAPTPQPFAPTTIPVLPPPSTTVPFPVAHYLHNLSASALMFPGSPQFLSVVATVRDGETFWQLHWDGGMSATALVMLLLSLLVLAFGLGAAYQHLRWRGLLPLGVFLIYLLADSLARTSGGRYLVPVDWILVAYFALGLAEGIRLLRSLAGANAGTAVATAAARPKRRKASTSRATKDTPQRQDNAWVGRTGIALVSIALIGGLIPLSGSLYPMRYAQVSVQGRLDRLNPYLQSLDLTRPGLEAFLGQPGAVLLDGRALYPRFYRRNAGELFTFVPFLPTPYPRTIFALIGPGGAAYTELPGPPPAAFPDASDAIVLGCQSPSAQQGYELLNAVAVVLPTQGVSYVRSPSAPLNCPLPVPVCNSNGFCR